MTSPMRRGGDGGGGRRERPSSPASSVNAPSVATTRVTTTQPRDYETADDVLEAEDYDEVEEIVNDAHDFSSYKSQNNYPEEERQQRRDQARALAQRSQDELLEAVNPRSMVTVCADIVRDTNQLIKASNYDKTVITEDSRIISNVSAYHGSYLRSINTSAREFDLNVYATKLRHRIVPPIIFDGEDLERSPKRMKRTTKAGRRPVEGEGGDQIVDEVEEDDTEPVNMIPKKTFTRYWAGKWPGLLEMSPTFEFLYGLFKSDPIVIEHRQQTRRGRDKEDLNEKRPKTMNIEDAQNLPDETTRKVAKLSKKLNKALDKHPTGVPYFEMIVNPNLFATTVENAYHMTFLFKELEVELVYNPADPDWPLIRRYVKKEPKPEAESPQVTQQTSSASQQGGQQNSEAAKPPPAATSSGTNSQSTLSFTMLDWRDWKKKIYGPDEGEEEGGEEENDDDDDKD